MNDIVFNRVRTSSSEIRKRDIIDDLKEMIHRYDFYQDETRRLLKDYEILEAENERLKEQKKSLVLALADEQWNNLHRSAMARKYRRRYKRQGLRGETIARVIL